MTREEAIRYLYSSGMSDEQVNAVVKALEQEPCEDCVSRQAVIDMCKKEIDHISKNWQNYHSPSEAKSGFVYISTNIYDFPSVTPQPKTGEWNTFELFQSGIKETWYECPKCKWSNALLIPRNYCPNCGAKMVEPQESEVKE